MSALLFLAAPAASADMEVVARCQEGDAVTVLPSNGAEDVPVDSRVRVEIVPCWSMGAPAEDWSLYLFEGMDPDLPATGALASVTHTVVNQSVIALPELELAPTSDYALLIEGAMGTQLRSGFTTGTGTTEALVGEGPTVLDSFAEISDRDGTVTELFVEVQPMDDPSGLSAIHLLDADDPSISLGSQAVQTDWWAGRPPGASWTRAGAHVEQACVIVAQEDGAGRMTLGEELCLIPEDTRRRFGCSGLPRPASSGLFVLGLFGLLFRRRA